MSYIVGFNRKQTVLFPRNINVIMGLLKSLNLQIFYFLTFGRKVSFYHQILLF